MHFARVRVIALTLACLPGVGRRRTNSCSRQTLAAHKPSRPSPKPTLPTLHATVGPSLQSPRCQCGRHHITACAATVSRRELQKRRRGKTRPQSRPANTQTVLTSAASLPSARPQPARPCPTPLFEGCRRGSHPADRRSPEPRKQREHGHARSTRRRGSSWDPAGETMA